MNVFALLDNAARRFPNHGAVFQGTRLEQDYATLRRRAMALACGLKAQVAAGDRIVIVSENCTQYLEILFGIWATDAAAVPVNAKLHALEILQIVLDADTRLVFASPRIAAELQSLANWPAEAKVITIGSPAFESLFDMSGALLPPDTAPEALAWLFYTSGTTGRSKGAMLTHRNLMVMTLAHLADIESLTEHDSQIHAAPMSHGSGLYILPSVSRAARQVIPASGGFDAAEFLDLCSHHPGCGAFLAPTMVQRLRLEAQASGKRPSQLRSIVYGGGPMYVEDLKKAQAIFGAVFAQIYGQGESPMTITGLRRADHVGVGDAVLGSVGWARTGCEVAIVGDQGQRLPVGEIGEVVCRGDTTMRGYWRNEAGTADALRQGWLYTGDLGSLDERGYLTLRDRSKDVVISGGSNVYPREVEEVLLAVAGVSEACVVGQPDPEWGEIVVAFVVLSDPAVTAEDLDRQCLSRIARFKRPKAYHFVQALPKNNYGKVLKRALREQLRA